MRDLAKYIDHTILKATTTQQDVVVLCNEAIAYGFAAVCVPPVYADVARRLLADTPIKIATVIGFPLGYDCIPSKLAAIQDAMLHGATEIDFVHNMAAIKNKHYEYAIAEVKACAEFVHSKGCAIKIIIESGVLSDEEIIACCKAYTPLNVDFIKTSTGYAEQGASVHAVQLIRQHIPSSMGIKASGGIKTAAFARELIAAGATRLGCSASIAIVKEDKPA
ncbi:deoxyribose-phosphate aldolase [Chitinophagaceae bacterium IBVUCB1]|nr:deoxyribose-phosphate aldolase [Chitinophagaceae bacterium IBVUCB1]